MTSHLLVTISPRRALFVACAVEDDVLPVTVFQTEHRLLQAALLFESLRFFLFRFLSLFIIGEEVKLLKRRLLCFLRRGDMICYDVHASDIQILIHDPVIQIKEGIHDKPGGRGRSTDVLTSVRLLGDCLAVSLYAAGIFLS